MKIVSLVSEMRALAVAVRRQGRRIGFVPTMGYLHEGHLSLLRRAREENDIVVASIFVNPAQFGPQEDLDRYPRDAEGDSRKCESVGVDVLFMPDTMEMYPRGPQVFVNVEGLSDILEGAVRPGHFRGVATIVAKLFNIVDPDRAYFGQKDYQQCVVIKGMVDGMDFRVEIVIQPTVREADGLAMSSRNVYLRADDRRKAAALYRALRAGEEAIRAGSRDGDDVRRTMRAVLHEEQGVSTDYLEVADPETLQPLDAIGTRAVLLVAARIGQTRLIDNMLILC